MDHESSNLQRIQRISRRLRWLIRFALLLAPLALALYWLTYNDLPPAAQAHGRIGVTIAGPVPALSRFAAFWISMIPTGSALWGLWILRTLFRLYESGRIFEEENVRCYRTIGRIFILHVIARVAAVPMLAIALSLHNPPGQKQLAFSLGSGEVFGLLAGCVILVIAAVMDEGRKLDLEQRLTV
jgi:hypothetical protein